MCAGFASLDLEPGPAHACMPRPRSPTQHALRKHCVVSEGARMRSLFIAQRHNSGSGPSPGICGRSIESRRALPRICPNSARAATLSVCDNLDADL